MANVAVHIHLQFGEASLWVCTCIINIRACRMHLRDVQYFPKPDGLQVATDWNMCQKLHSEPFGIESDKVDILMDLIFGDIRWKQGSRACPYRCSSIIIKWTPECNDEDLPTPSIRTSCDTSKDRGKSEEHLVLMVMVCEANLNLFARSLQLLNEAAWEPLDTMFARL